MNISTGRMQAAAIAGTAIALLVAGCASAPGGALDGNPEESGSAESEPTPAPLESGIPIEEPSFETAVAWLEEGATLELTTWGSSSCPAEVAEVLLDAPDRVILQMAPPSDGACTMDMAPTTQNRAARGRGRPTARHRAPSR